MGTQNSKKEAVEGIRRAVAEQLGDITDCFKKIENELAERPHNRTGQVQLSLQPKSGQYILHGGTYLGTYLHADYRHTDGVWYRIQIGQIQARTMPSGERK